MSYPPVPNPPPTQQAVDVLSVVDIPSNDPTRIGKMDALITYRLDPMHTFTIKIPAETITPDVLDAAVRADFNKRKVLIRRHITV